MDNIRSIKIFSSKRYKIGLDEMTKSNHSLCRPHSAHEEREIQVFVTEVDGEILRLIT